MPSPYQSGLLVGFVAGAAVMAAGVLVLRPAPAESRPPAPVLAPAAPDPQLQEENQRLSKRLEELERARSTPPAAASPAAAPKPEKPAAASVVDLFGKLVESGLAGFRSPKFAETLEAVKREGTPAIGTLSEILKKSTSATERFYAAALLEGAGDASAIPALATALQSDKDDLVRRMASHAIALLGTPAAESPLKRASTEDSDWGVRVNSAYGLAKMNNEAGLQLLRESYESPETPPEYRLAVLSGLADVAAPSTAPLFRKILSDTKDVSYLLASIAALEKMKDAESLPALQQLSTTSTSDIIKQAATRAVDAIRK